LLLCFSKKCRIAGENGGSMKKSPWSALSLGHALVKHP
jgi:hypothetical protein